MVSGGVSNNKAENEDASSRSVKEAEAGGESSRVKAKRGPEKAWSKFKRATHSSSRSYSSSSQAKTSGISLICHLNHSNKHMRIS